MKIETQPTVELTDCPKCGGTASLTMEPTPAFVKYEGEMRQVFVPGKLVHLSGYVQCAKTCNKGCGKPGYMKHITQHKRVFVHTETSTTECSK